MDNIKKKISPIQSNIGVWASRQSAEHLLNLMKNKSNYDYLVPYYIAAICAGMEGEINTAYVNHFHKKFGNNYNHYVRPIYL